MSIIGVSETVMLPRRGKIRLGEKKLGKGGVEYPSALDYFAVPEEVAEIYGEKPRKLDVMIPTENIEEFFPQWYKRYGSSAGLLCKGNGKVATAMMDAGGMGEVECHGRECTFYQEKACKQIGNLQIILPKVKGLGVYQIDTSSWNSIVNINSGLKMVKGMLGRMSWIPLVLEVKMQEAHPTVNGKKIKTIVPVMSVTSDISVCDLLKMRLPARQAEIVNSGVDDKPDLLFPGKDGSIPGGEEAKLDLSNGKEKVGFEEPTRDLSVTDNGGTKGPGSETVPHQGVGAAALGLLDETEVKDGEVLTEEEAQNEQARAMEPEHDKDWQDRTRRTWYRLLTIMFKVNYFGDTASYRAWMVENLDGINSYKLLTDNQKIRGNKLMEIQANKHEEKK